MNEWLHASEVNFEALILQIPYIGGKENIFTQFLVSPSMLIPIIRILKEENVSTRKIGQIIFEIAEKGYNLMPKPIR